jgi:hypothetical protein
VVDVDFVVGGYYTSDSPAEALSRLLHRFPQISNMIE